MVRGFWGDIINSPYMSFGNEVDDPDDYMRFYKQVNFQNIYSNADVSEYNVQKIIFQMEELDEFEYRFERLRHILQDKYDDPSGKKPRPKKKREKLEKLLAEEEDSKVEDDAEKTTMASENKNEDGKSTSTNAPQQQLQEEEEETMIEEITDEQAEQIEKEQAEREAEEQRQKEEEEAQKKKAALEKKKKEAEDSNQIKDKDPMKGFDKAKQTIDLGDIPEGITEVKEENIGTRKLLQAFSFLNVKIHLLTDDLNKLYKKQKYQDYFDVGVLSINSADKMKEEDNKNIWKPGAKIHIETCDQLCILKKEQRQQYRDKVKEYAGQVGWKEMKSHYSHHMLYDVGK